MGVRKSWEAMVAESRDGGDHAAVCTFCGESAWSGYWMAHNGDVFTCHHCAVTVLPKLIADSVVGSLSRPGVAEAIVERVQREFWYALSLALLARERQARGAFDEKLLEVQSTLTEQAGDLMLAIEHFVCAGGKLEQIRINPDNPLLPHLPRRIVSRMIFDKQMPPDIAYFWPSSQQTMDRMMKVRSRSHVKLEISGPDDRAS